MCIGVLGSATVLPAEGVPFDLASPPTGTTAVYFREAEGGQRGVPMDVADFNGSGVGDVAAGAFSASTSGLRFNGRVHVLIDVVGNQGAVDVGNTTRASVLIDGVESHSLLGVDIRAADLDGDGFGDLILGSSHGVYRSQAEAAGEVVILFGNAQWGSTITNINLRSLPPGQRALFILGERNFDRLGSWFSVGDVDRSGKPELLIGMDLSDGPAGGRTNAGAAVLVWDVADLAAQRSVVRVGDLESSPTMTVFYGKDPGDLMGATNFIGDPDGDGQPDLILSAGVTRSGLSFLGTPLFYPGTGGGDGPDGTRTDAGEVYILWDAARWRGVPQVQLGGVAPADMTTIYGPRPNGRFGEELFTGDLTGDGIEDLFVGALTDRPPTTTQTTGSGFILHGASLLRSLPVIDLLTPPPHLITAIYGTEQNSIAGDTVEMGDINGDGVMDLLYGVPEGPAAGRTRAGYVICIFGGQPFRTLPEFYTSSSSGIDGLTDVMIYGADAGDSFDYSSAIGDLNGDGFVDFLPNAMRGDGFNNVYSNAGEYYVVDGLLLSRHAAAPVVVTPAGDVLARWLPSAPVLGNVEAYEVVYTMGGIPGTFQTAVTEVRPGDAPPGAFLVSVQSLQRRDGILRQSIAVALNVQVPTTTPTPTATTTPTMTATPTPTVSPTPIRGDLIAHLLSRPPGDASMLDSNGDGVTDAADIP